MDLIVRRICSNILDRGFSVALAGSVAKLTEIGIFEFFLLFLLIDFAIYVAIRSVLLRTPGDIMFGIKLSACSLRWAKLILRWLLGYLSPLTAFLLHIPAVNYRSLCDAISGIKTEII